MNNSNLLTLYKFPPHSLAIYSQKDQKTLIFEDNKIALDCDFKPDGVSERTFVRVGKVFGCLGLFKDKLGAVLVVITSCEAEVNLSGATIYQVKSIELHVFKQRFSHFDFLKRLQKFFEDGSFYFSYHMDLSLSRQRYHQHSLSDDQYFWNRNLLTDFYEAYVPKTFYVEVIRGFVQFQTLWASGVGLISRTSCRRAGTRFLTRGINDEGFVANFVETEQILENNDNITSFCQIRGSVPLFWEQKGLNLGRHKIQFSRSLEAMLPAFKKHFSHLVRLFCFFSVIHIACGGRVVYFGPATF
jgi:hypothetical protein